MKKVFTEHALIGILPASDFEPADQDFSFRVTTTDSMRGNILDPELTQLFRLLCIFYGMHLKFVRRESVSQYWTSIKLLCLA